MISPHRRARYHLTLVEILVIVAILAVLVGLLFPALRKALNQSYRVIDVNNQRQLAISIAQFAGDHYRLIPGVIDTYKTGNRDMTKWRESQIRIDLLQGTSRQHYLHCHNLAADSLLLGLGSLAAFGYVENPDLFFPPGFVQPDEGGQTGLICVRWNEVAYSAPWNKLINDDYYWSMECGISYMAYSPNNSNEPYKFAMLASHPNMTLEIMASRHLEPWCSAMLTASANFDIIFKPGNEDGHPEWGKSYGFSAWNSSPYPKGVWRSAPGTVGSFYDGSVRWSSGEELAASGYSPYTLAPYGITGLHQWARKEARP
ncbi:MAG: type II secretion system protein [Planctomycetes bacterium]|nr:type II secretion system protein [Planctomycetota bacterium]